MTLAYLSTVQLHPDASRDLAVDPDAIGVIVDVFDDCTYEVEFSDASDGSTLALLTLSEDQIEPADMRSPMSARRLAD